MALLNLVGFETGDFSECLSVTGSPTVSSSSPLDETYSLLCDTSGGAATCGVRITLHGADAKIAATINRTAATYYYCRFRFVGSVDNSILLDIHDESSGSVASIYPSSGTLFVNGASLFENTGESISADTTYELEMQATSNGASEVWLDGVSIHTFTAANRTQNTLRLGWPGNSIQAQVKFDTIIISDAPIGQRKHITVAVPTGDSATNTAWTASAGNKWACIDDIPPSAADNITSGTGAGDQRYSATHATAAALGIAGDIEAVKVVARMSEVSSTTTLGAIGIRSGTTNFETTNVDIGNTADITMAVVHSVDPNTTAAWTASGFNSAEPIVKRSTSDTSNIECAALYLMVVWEEAPAVPPFRRSLLGVGF